MNNSQPQIPDSRKNTAAWVTAVDKTDLVRVTLALGAIPEVKGMTFGGRLMLHGEFLRLLNELRQKYGATLNDMKNSLIPSHESWRRLRQAILRLEATLADSTLWSTAYRK